MELPNYFDSIALGLPGGGYRAAGFSLGILSFLSDCDMLRQVKSISTVSGGTITGVSYAKSVAQGTPFDVYFDELKEWLQEDNLVSDALDILNNGNQFGHKKHNLINAFALQYKTLVGEYTFGELAKKLKDSATLCEVIFNATDFENGNAFRFKNKDRFGNGKVTYPPELIDQVKLADIIAASSCFPGAFEPIIFPGDFVKGDYSVQEIPLMDGGIIDNQGSSSFTTGTDLNHSCYFLADAGGYKIEGFKPAVGNKLTRNISALFSPWILLILLLSTIGSYFLLPYEIIRIILVILTTFFSTLQIGLFALQKFAEKKSGINVPFKLPRSKIGLYLVDRVSSVLLLNTSIFLKGSKSRNLTSIFEEGGAKVSKLSIYGLMLDDEGKPLNIQLWDKIKMVIGDHYPSFLSDRSEAATNFDTTLWFNSGDKNKVLDDLIFTGKTVCCLNIISHVIKNIKSDISTDVYSKYRQTYKDNPEKLQTSEIKKEILATIDNSLEIAIEDDSFIKYIKGMWIELVSLKG